MANMWWTLWYVVVVVRVHVVCQSGCIWCANQHKYAYPIPQDHVEDTKGNDGLDGRLLITNLRIVWHAKPWTDNNMSVGLNLITSIESRKITSTVAGLMVVVVHKTACHCATW